MNNGAVDVGQSKISARVSISEPFVVEAHQVQHRGVQIVNVRSIFHSLVAELVCAPPGYASFYATACQPDAESMMIVIATGGRC